ncbi:ABC transporter permease [Paenibacillus polymyxa]|uniref:ABC transporter permease n=1 Tax=Paenibacillus polymyxa TaxID=1406 RepID=UPI0004D38240|nr:ABC transporter permease [Paenibacillus polymyxa]KEO78830.1 ABC transporter permease [Paenibacillus polymyxa]MCH6187886.1 ABC transporter permease [Paenibacillus polymyxa]MDY8092542.1 ABC transporter permease [Paenibacillus polymyxa]WRL57360.1 ABC transporter permease [Paenibacillus polymyxa]
MKTLIYSEFERLYGRKWFWLLILCTPVLAYSTASYFLYLKTSVEVLSKVFVIIGLQENLFLICNIAVAALVATLYTEQFRGGQLRLIFMRRFTRGQIFWSKLLVLQVSVLLLLLILGLSLWGVGVWRFPYSEGETRQYGELIMYVFQYYAKAFVSLMAIGCLYSYIAMCSKSVTHAIGICTTYNLFSLLFDGLYLKLASLFSHIPYIHDLIVFLFIPYMQYRGLKTSLSGNLSANGAIATVVILYLILFTWGAYRRFTKDDYLY